MPIMIVTILLILFALILVFASFFFLRIALDGKSKGADTTAELSPAEFEQNQAERVSWLKANASSWHTDSFDGLSLHAYFVKGCNHKYIISAHGYRGSSDFNVDHVKPLVAKGWNALLIDQRAHGLSEGRYISMGWKESRDILSWIDSITAFDGEAEIILHGISMGGATVMMAAGLSLPENVKGVIEDCGYTSVWDIFAHQMKKLYHLPPFPMLSLTSLICRLRFGFTFKEASALDRIKQAKVPVLFIHGDADSFVPFCHMDRLYQSCASPKQKVVIKGAGHAFAYRCDPALYSKSVEDFITSYV